MMGKGGRREGAEVEIGVRRGDIEDIRTMTANHIDDMGRGIGHGIDLEMGREIGTRGMCIEGSGHGVTRGEEMTIGLLDGHGNEAIHLIRITDAGIRGIEKMTIDDEHQKRRFEDTSNCNCISGSDCLIHIRGSCSCVQARKN